MTNHNDTDGRDSSGAGARGWFGQVKIPWSVIVGVVLAAIIITFYVGENIRGRAAWERFKRECEAKGIGLDLASVLPEPVPDEQNFAMAPIVASCYDPGAIRQIGTSSSSAYLLPKTKLDMSVGLGNYDYPDLGSWRAAKRLDLEAWQGYYRSLPAIAHVFAEAPETQSAAADVLQALSVYSQAIDELRRAALRPYVSSPLVYDDPTKVSFRHMTTFKRAAEVLVLHAVAELGLGRTDAALMDLKVLWRKADVLRSEPMLISHLVRIPLINLSLQPVWEGLADHRWTDAELLELEKELARLDLLADFRFALQGEMVLFQQAWFERLRKRPGTVVAALGVKMGLRQRAVALLLNLIPDGWVYDAQTLSARIVLEWYFPLADPKTKVVVPAHVTQTNTYTETSLAKLTPRSILAKLFMYPPANFLKRTAECQAAVDLARVAIALERYRLAHGAYPESLDQLVPRFMDRVPHDIVNRRPLVYRRDPQRGFVLYSVGWNETDDGGQAGLRSAGSREWERGDLVWTYPAE